MMNREEATLCSRKQIGLRAFTLVGHARAPRRRNPVTRSKPNCQSIFGMSPLPFNSQVCTPEETIDICTVTDGHLVATGRNHRFQVDCEPWRGDPTEVRPSFSSLTCPALGSLVNATHIVTVVSKSRVPTGSMGSQRASFSVDFASSGRGVFRRGCQPHP
jgi:hypothetical protein